MTSTYHAHESVWTLGERLRGRRILRLCRIFLQHNDHYEDTSGQLELYLNDGIMLFEDWCGSIDMFSVSEGPWQDLFERPLELEENYKYIEETGHFARVDVSEQPNYRDLLAQEIKDVALLLHEHGVVSGVKLVTTQRTLWYGVSGDEGYVYWEMPEMYKNL